MEQCQNIMLIVKSIDDSIAIQKLLVSSGYKVISIPYVDNNVVDDVSVKSSDVIIIYVDSPDKETFELAKKIRSLQPTPIVMFSRDGDEVLAQKAVASNINAYVVDGFSTRRIATIISVAIARFRHEQALNNELEKVRASLLERKTVEKAKGILMRQRMVDEDVAYAMLRKQSMNRGKKMFDIAEEVISTSELLG